MRIAFADFSQIDFHAQTVDALPLGGSQSAACYLGRALARLGHDIFLISKLSSPGLYDGVHCLSWLQTHAAELCALRLDVLVSIMSPRSGPKLREVLPPPAKLILWNHHAADQDDAQPLRDPRLHEVFDAMAMVSRWQLEQYQQAFGISPGKMTVMRNAIAPAFANQFGGGPILAQKSSPPILAYTSTPFRGLELLLAAFSFIRAAVPQARLQVFSSMKVYGVTQQADETQFGDLYRLCHQIEGVEYIGSIPQPQLAQALRGAMVLAYPNVFPETSCIAVMEAMASGCRIVTSQLGALPDTTAGFARLIPIDPTLDVYMQQFIEQTIEAIGDCTRRVAETESLLQRQVAHVNAELTWELRAAEWVRWLESQQ